MFQMAENTSTQQMLAELLTLIYKYAKVPKK